jgi:glutaconate CoA-transferase subunit A
VSEFCDLFDVVERFVHDGQTVALEGFTHLIAFAAGQEMIRRTPRESYAPRPWPATPR